MKYKHDIHIGELIKNIFEKSSLSISEFAKKLNCERTNIYRIFKRKSVDTDLLMNISEILNHDFFCHLYNEASISQNNMKLSIEVKDNYIEIIKHKNIDIFIKNFGDQ